MERIRCLNCQVDAQLISMQEVQKIQRNQTAGKRLMAQNKFVCQRHPDREVSNFSKVDGDFICEGCLVHRGTQSNEMEVCAKEQIEQYMAELSSYLIIMNERSTKSIQQLTRILEAKDSIPSDQVRVVLKDSRNVLRAAIFSEQDKELIKNFEINPNDEQPVKRSNLVMISESIYFCF